MKLANLIKLSLAAALSLAIAGAALAMEPPEDEKAPASSGSTPEKTIAASLKLILDGKFDEYIRTWCHPEACHNDNAIKSLKRYNLPATQRRAGPCLKPGKKVKVTRTDGDPAKDKDIKVFIDCGDKRMPPPAGLRKDGDTWKVMRFSW